MESIRYVQPNEIYRWTGSTQQDLEEFVEAIGFTVEMCEINTDGGFVYGVGFYDPPKIIPAGYWYVADDVYVPNENISDFLNQNRLGIVDSPNGFEFVVE